MQIRIFNTLAGAKQEFEPITRGHVGMYHCGPTVYNYAHIGNLRAYVFADIVRRTFEHAGYKAKQVINITDVGHLTSDADTGADKMEEGAKREGKTAAEIADFYTDAFFENLHDLNVLTKETIFPKATEHIAEQIELIQKLEDKGFAYKTSDGIYFDTARFKDYGKLGRINLAGLTEGARVEINSEKRHPTDFALWKFSQPHERRQQEWESPWGVGFPGWHIECSAMSMKYLGEVFDIHTGGIDHIPVHHNNEIAQSVSGTGKEYVHYWMHNAFITERDEKMAKSKGNFLTLESIKEKGISPLAYRYWLLTSHYRSPANFSLEAVESADTALTKLKKFVDKVSEEGVVLSDWVEKFESFIFDDFNTPEALALVWKLARSRSASDADKKATILAMDEVLGLELDKAAPKERVVIPAEIKRLLKEREEVRKAKNFARSDELRDEIAKFGFAVSDTEIGQEVSLLDKN